MTMREITILHVEGCPGAGEAKAEALAVAAGRPDVVVRDVTVRDEEAAIAAGLRGSPTVLVDGRDVEPECEIPIGAMT